MAELFSDDWMKSFANSWNAEPEIKDVLAGIGFNSTIAFGFKGEGSPTGVFVVENGECTRSGSYDSESLDWDIRADRKNWDKWASNGIGMAGLGMAYASGKMKFEKGDYGSMIKNPKMAGPFIKCFGLMKGL